MVASLLAALACLSPAEAILTTSTRQLTGVQILARGDLIVTTMGGAFRVSMADGRAASVRLKTPAVEATGLSSSATEVVIRTPRSTASFPAAGLAPLPLTAKDRESGMRAKAMWRGKLLTVGLAGGMKWGGAAFSPQPPGLIQTCLAADARNLYVGTADAGLWRLSGSKFVRVPLPGDDLPSHNIVGFCGEFAFTLDSGVLRRGFLAWEPVQGSVALARQALRTPTGWLVRDANSQVWQTDANLQNPAQWNSKRPPTILHAEAGVTASLTVGGGAFVDSADGTTVENLVDLDGAVPTAAAVSPEAVWVGTQAGGLARLDRKTGKLEWIDRGPALGDDWVTCLAYDPKRDELAIGTFVGGLSLLKGGKIERVRGVTSPNVTSLLNTSSGLLAGTRTGLFRVTGSEAKYVPMPNLPYEIQALALSGDSVLIGTRTGIVEMPIPSP